MRIKHNFNLEKEEEVEHTCEGYGEAGDTSLLSIPLAQHISALTRGTGWFTI